MNRPTPSIPFDKLCLVNDTLVKFENAVYRNETVIDILKKEQVRLKAEWNATEQALSEWECDKEQAVLDAERAAKREKIDSYLSRMPNSDKDKALDLLDRLNKLKSGTVIYDEYEIELNRLFRFYDAI